MLSLYDPIVVPGVERVVLYRDDERTNRFFMVTDKASLVRDESGAPLFTFVLYARDLDRLAENDRDVERGYLALSTQVDGQRRRPAEDPRLPSRSAQRRAVPPAAVPRPDADHGRAGAPPTLHYGQKGPRK